MDEKALLQFGQTRLVGHFTARAGNIQLMRLAPVRGGEVRRRRRTSMCRAYVLMRRAAVDPKAAVRCSIPKALSILVITDIAAVWVQAIERRARNEVADVLDKPVAPARRWYHAISHAPGPRTQWRIRPHRPIEQIKCSRLRMA